jgi:hypothetical protein
MELSPSLITGLATGLALGIGIGLLVGKRQSRAMLHTFLRRNDLTIRDATGQPVSLDEFLEAALEIVDDRQSRRAAWLFLVGVVVLVGVLILLGLYW